MGGEGQTIKSSVQSAQESEVLNYGILNYSPKDLLTVDKNNNKNNKKQQKQQQAVAPTALPNFILLHPKFNMHYVC